MSNIKKILLELSRDTFRLPETHNDAKNKISSRVNLDPCLCKGKGTPCGSKSCVQKRKISEGQSKRKAESAIEKICNCDGGCSLDPSDHEKSCPAYKKLQDGDYSGDDIDAAEYKYGKDR
jgi:hypothetical protein